MDFAMWQKIIIYVLTFLAYSWTGYGATILEELKNAVMSIHGEVSDLIQNGIKVALKIHDLSEVFEAAVEETCVFTCPGGVMPEPRRNFTPRTNGCGTLGFEIDPDHLPKTEMSKCCDIHDICYDTCNADKHDCDVKFQRCLFNYCATYEETSSTLVKTCKKAAKLLYTGTTALGCKSYLDGQKDACYCSKKPNGDNNKKSKHHSHTRREL